MERELWDEIVVDNFAGGGGASAGIKMAIGRDVDIAINHDPDAIAMHKANHPYTEHYNESVWDIDPVTATGGGHFSEVRAFLIKYYGQGEGQKLDEPLHTITTKDRFGLITVAGQEYQIIDIGMRMLTPRELFRAQGFPDTYIIECDYLGRPYPKTAQVARCGNAVPPQLPAALVRANLPELCGIALQKAM